MKRFLTVLLLVSMTAFSGCGSKGDKNTASEIAESQGMEENTEVSDDVTEKTIGLAHETAKDAKIDFQTLQEENPDIFAWLQIPGTDIDVPILQSEEADDFYEHHNAFSEADEKGAVYTELANLKNMCDFNTVLHGKSDKEDTPFSELYQFANPDFFKEHETIYIYLPDNLLTYEIFAAYERENTSLIRTYDFTYASGCEQFLDELYHGKAMGKNLREEWEGITPYHFLITLTTESSQNTDKQLVVVAALVGDAAGEINRVVEE